MSVKQYVDVSTFFIPMLLHRAAVAQGLELSPLIREDVSSNPGCSWFFSEGFFQQWKQFFDENQKIKK